MHSFWLEGFRLENLNIWTRQSRAASRISWYPEEMHSLRSSKETSFQHSFTIDLVTGTLMPRKRSPSPYCPFPVLKKLDRPSTREGLAACINLVLRIFIYNYPTSYDAKFVNSISIVTCNRTGSAKVRFFSIPTNNYDVTLLDQKFLIFIF